jgi:hypothetical protein
MSFRKRKPLPASPERRGDLRKPPLAPPERRGQNRRRLKPAATGFDRLKAEGKRFWGKCYDDGNWKIPQWITLWGHNRNVPY